MDKGVKERFSEAGYMGPIRVLPEGRCRLFLEAVNRKRGAGPLEWNKGHAATSRAYYEMARQPAIVGVVRELLGGNLILWGASVIAREAEKAHPWHTDMETATGRGSTVSVWVGLENTNRESALSVIPGSQKFDVSFQEARHIAGKGYNEISDGDALCLAREREPMSQLLQPVISDGEALFFDGQLWHSSLNLGRETRRALLLQYASSGTAIHIPVPANLDWPLRHLAQPRPPSVMIRGSADPGVNRIIPGPVAESGKGRLRLTSGIYPVELPLASDDDGKWKGYHIFRGATGDVNDLSCHVSVLNSGHCPHPRHDHSEEEILILFAGEVNLLLEGGEVSGGERRVPLRAGQFVYYPAYFSHSLETTSEGPATYLMLKWRGSTRTRESLLPFGLYDIFESAENGAPPEGFKAQRRFDGPTDCLRKLHCHASVLAPGAGYDTHIDAHDVVIVVLEGEVETLGERVGPHSVILYPAGESHGMSNPGEVAAKYIVFEFHGFPGRTNEDFPPAVPEPLKGWRLWMRKLARLTRPLRERFRSDGF